MPKTLILLRHAKSSWATAGLADRDRPLNERGRRNAPVMANRLRQRGLKWDRLITSPAVRAQETVAYFADALEMGDPRVVIEPRLYGATGSEWLQLIQALSEEWSNVLMAGHNPTLTELALRLGRTDISNVPTCGWLECRYEGGYWGNFGDDLAQLNVDFDYPKRPE